MTLGLISCGVAYRLLRDDQDSMELYMLGSQDDKGLIKAVIVKLKEFARINNCKRIVYFADPSITSLMIEVGFYFIEDDGVVKEMIEIRNAHLMECRIDKRWEYWEEGYVF